MTVLIKCNTTTYLIDLTINNQVHLNLKKPILLVYCQYLLAYEALLWQNAGISNIEWIYDTNDILC